MNRIATLFAVMVALAVPCAAATIVDRGDTLWVYVVFDEQAQYTASRTYLLTGPLRDAGGLEVPDVTYRIDGVPIPAYDPFLMADARPQVYGLDRVVEERASYQVSESRRDSAETTIVTWTRGTLHEKKQLVFKPGRGHEVALEDTAATAAFATHPDSVVHRARLAPVPKQIIRRSKW